MQPTIIARPNRLTPILRGISVLGRGVEQLSADYDRTHPSSREERLKEMANEAYLLAHHLAQLANTQQEP